MKAIRNKHPPIVREIFATFALLKHNVKGKNSPKPIVQAVEKSRLKEKGMGTTLRILRVDIRLALARFHISS